LGADNCSKVIISISLYGHCNTCGDTSLTVGTT
jgi:hypothetical protein